MSTMGTSRRERERHRAPHLERHAKLVLSTLQKVRVEAILIQEGCSIHDARHEQRENKELL